MKKPKDSYAIVVGSGEPDRGWRIPAPPDHERAAGFVGDYRPLAERRVNP